MLRFDHATSQTGVGGPAFVRTIHRSESTHNERVAAPAIYWSGNCRMRLPRLVLASKNQMSD